MRVRMDPEQLAGMGIDEEIAIDLPDGFERHTPAQRRAWVQGQIEAIALEMLADLGGMRGVVPTPDQAAAYLAGTRPGIDEALAAAGGGPPAGRERAAVNDTRESRAAYKS